MNSLIFFFFSSFFITPTLYSFASPTNDECANAFEITHLTICDTIHLNVAGATPSNNINGCDENAIDIWYKFTAKSTNLKLRGLEFSNYSSDYITYEIYTDGCLESIRLNNGCTQLMEGDSHIRGNLMAGEEYYLRIWFNSGQEADICLEFLCDFAINSHTVTVCDSTSNTYDLEVEVSGNNLKIGDSLTFFSNYSIPADNGFKIEQTDANYTFNLTDLPATDNPVVLSVRERNNGCEQYFYNVYTAPPPCVNSPLNDECLNAIEIANLSICDTMHVSVAGATSNNLNFSCGPEAVDVWYKFTAEGSGIGIEWIEFSDYRNSTIVGFEIYSDNCAATTRVNNTCYSARYEGSVSEIRGLTDGNEYYIRIWFYIGQEADFCLKSICSMDATPVISNCNNENNTYDLNIETNVYGLTIGDTLMLFISDLSIERELPITSSEGLYNFEISDLPATGSRYNYSISEKGSNCRERKFYNAPVPCVSRPTNDNCSNAIEISDLSISKTIHISTFGATSEQNTNGCESSRVDIWYKFTATSSMIKVRGLELSNYGTRYLGLEVYTDECGGSSRINNRCYTIEEGYGNTIRNLIVGEEYYLRFWIRSNVGIEGDISLESACTSFSGISYNECNPIDNTYFLLIPISAVDLEIGDSLVLRLDNGRYASNGLKITSPDIEEFEFFISRVPATGNKFGFSVFEWNGGCNERYFFDSFRGEEPCVNPPSNNNCLDAIEIEDLSNCNLLHPNTFGATSNDLTACDLSVIDVWYQFTANISSINFGNMNTAYSNPYGSMNIEIYSGSCDNLVSVNNSCYTLCDTCDFTLDNLVIGERYYIRATSGETYEADFCVQAQNGNICNPSLLSFTSDTTNQATYQTQQTITAQGRIVNSDSTTFISENSITLMPGFHAEAGAKFHAYIKNCTPPVTLVEIPSENRHIEKIIEKASLITINELIVAPNPFTQSTFIKYTLMEDAAISLNIFSMDGRLVEKIVPFQPQIKGNYEYVFAPKENTGNIYFAVMTTPEHRITKKMIFIR